MKWKGRTRIGLMAGFEYGASFFREWRVAKAHKDLIERKVDFIICVSLLNIESLNARLVQEQLAAKRNGLLEERASIQAEIETLDNDPESASSDKVDDTLDKKTTLLEKIDRKLERLAVKKSEITIEAREAFATRIATELATRVVPPLKVNGSTDIIKYWVYPCPFFEFKGDDFNIAALVYDMLPIISMEHHGLDTPYIRVDDIKSVVEVEDRVAIKTIGIVTPSVSAFRARVLSTAPEREIAYQQLSWQRDLPDFYIAAMFGTSIDEPNPRGVPTGRPYISVPSLAIRSRFAESVLPNSLGYGILHLYPSRKNRGAYKSEFFSLNDASELEYRFAKDQLAKIKDEKVRAVASTILEKVRIGTKVTLGKIEDHARLKKAQVSDAIRALQGTEFAVELNEEKGEIKNPHTIIPKTNEDLTRYRKGDSKVINVLLGACFHAGDVGVDYRFIEEDLPQIIHEEETEVVILAGDLTEGNKYNQDRKEGTLDGFPTSESHERLSGWLVANSLFESFRLNYEKNRRVKSALVTCIVIPGNHDTEQKNPGPVLKHFHNILVSRLIWQIDRYLKRMGVDYRNTQSLVRQKILLLDNPSVYEEFGIIHEHMGGSQQSTHKGQNALKQFSSHNKVRVIAVGNYHELNVCMVRIGTQTFAVFTLGTFKRGISPFENKRSKVPEFGIAASKITMQNGNPVNVQVKLIPGQATIDMEEREAFIDKNRKRGRTYHEKIRAWERRTS